MAAVRRKARQDPAQIQKQLEKAAWVRSRIRQAQKSPANWNIDEQQLKFSANDDGEVFVSPSRDNKGQVLDARRLDAFDQLHRFKSKDGRRGLEAGQHIAARRLMRDEAQRRGIRTDEPKPWLSQRVDEDVAPDLLPGWAIDAGRRADRALTVAGPRSAALLAGLIRPMFGEGVARPWREQVEQLTGESDRNAQGALVRHACEDLRLAYEAIDTGRKPFDGQGPL